MRRDCPMVFLILAMLCAGCATAPLERPKTASPTPTRGAAPEPTPTAAPSLTVLAPNWYLDPVGSLRFLFQAQNLSPFPVEQVRATVSLKAGDGQLVARQSAYAKSDLVRPGESAPVLVVFFLASHQFESYDIDLQAYRADYVAGLLHPALEIVDLSGRVGEWVPYEILGSVVNAGDHDVGSVVVTATCFDSQGRTAAIVSGGPEQRLIPAGESSEFLLSVGSMAGKIAGCEARAEGLTPHDSD